jgi:hypothetical protein
LLLTHFDIEIVSKIQQHKLQSSPKNLNDDGTNFSMCNPGIVSIPIIYLAHDLLLREPVELVEQQEVAQGILHACTQRAMCMA